MTEVGFPDALGVERVLVIGTGAVGVCHLPTVVTLLRRHYGADTAVCLTASARQLVSGQALAVLAERPVIASDWAGADRPLHVDWAAWPEVVIVWPATMRFLARCAYGLTGDVPSSIVVATEAPVFIAPSVASGVIASGPYGRAIESLRRDGRHVVDPIAGHGVSSWRLTDGACAPLDTVLRAVARVTLTDERAPSSVAGGGR